MSEYTDATVLVVDNGWYCELAPRLAEEFATVLYWSPWQGDFPYAADVAPGAGLEGVTRIEKLHDYIPLADLVVFPADGYDDLQEALRRDGKRVWGSGRGFELERDRVAFKAYLQSYGLPVIEHKLVTGIEQLHRALRDPDYDGWHIKLVKGYRGDMETFTHVNWQRSRSWFYSTAEGLGPMGDFTTWMMEPHVEGFEGGGDTYTVGGQMPGLVIVGYEIKDTCYVSTVQMYSSLSAPIRQCFDVMEEWFKITQAKTLFSTEVRITDDGTAYFIDLAARMPWPPSGTWMCNCTNLGEIMYYGAEGVLVEPDFRKTFAVELLIESPWWLGKGKWLAVEMPDEVRPWVKLHGVAKFGDVYWLRPQEQRDQGGSVGTVCAISNDFDEAVDKVQERAKLVDGQGLIHYPEHIQKAREEIEKGEEAGIKFF